MLRAALAFAFAALCFQGASPVLAAQPTFETLTLKQPVTEWSSPLGVLAQPTHYVTGSLAAGQTVTVIISNSGWSYVEASGWWVKTAQLKQAAR